MKLAPAGLGPPAGFLGIREGKAFPGLGSRTGASLRKLKRTAGFAVYRPGDAPRVCFDLRGTARWRRRDFFLSQKNEHTPASLLRGADGRLTRSLDSRGI